MKNLKKIVTLAALALALTLSLASAKEANAATTMTKKQVAKAIAAAQEKAINKRKVVKVTVTFETKKSTYKYMDQIDDLVAQEYWGKLYMCTRVTEAKYNKKNTKRNPGSWYYSDAPFDIDLDGYSKGYDGKWTCDDDKTFYSKWTKDGDEYTVIFKFMGNHKDYKNAVKEKECEEKIYDALVPTTVDMTQAQKVCYVMDWFGYRMSYNANSHDTSAKAIWNGTAYGRCENYADMVQKYLLMAGVKHVANVSLTNHAIIAVRFEDGKVYLLEPQYDEMRSADTDEEALKNIQELNKDSYYGGTRYYLTWEDGNCESYVASMKKAYYSKYSW